MKSQRWEKLKTITWFGAEQNEVMIYVEELQNHSELRRKLCFKIVGGRQGGFSILKCTLCEKEWEEHVEPEVHTKKCILRPPDIEK